MDAKSEILEFMDIAGIKLDGNNPWDIKVTNADFYARTLKYGSLGLGESYMDDWWECGRIDQFFERILNVNIETKLKTHKLLLLKLMLFRLFNRQTKKRAMEVGEKHYDLGNDLFTAMLDKHMIYLLRVLEIC